MTVVLFIGAYLLIGGILAGAINDEDLTPGLIFGWPIMVLIMLIMGIYRIAEFAGRMIVTAFKLIFNYIKT